MQCAAYPRTRWWCCDVHLDEALAVDCSMLQCVIVCCSALQYVAVRRSVFACPMAQWRCHDIHFDTHKPTLARTLAFALTLTFTLALALALAFSLSLTRGLSGGDVTSILMGLASAASSPACPHFDRSGERGVTHHQHSNILGNEM